MSNVLIVLDFNDSAVKKGSLPGITFGKEMAAKSGGELNLLLVGKGAAAAADSAAAFGAAKVFTVEGEAFDHCLSEAATKAVIQAAEACGAKYIASTSGSTSKDILPRVAARLEAAMASDVLSVVDDKTFTRPMWAGNVIATVELASDYKVCTIRATEFDAPTEGDKSAVEALSVDVDLGALKAKFVSLVEIKSERPDLSTADRVIAGGRGVKGEDSFKSNIEDLADELGAAVGASRAVCDAGWAPNDLQVGQTGKVVAPDLYIAIGISGAIQHLAGMKSSKVIVAINKDPEAPIFQVADYGLEADLNTAVPELLAKIKAL